MVNNYSIPKIEIQVTKPKSNPSTNPFWVECDEELDNAIALLEAFEETWAITDWSEEFGKWEPDKYEVEEIIEYAELYAQHGDAVVAFVEWHGVYNLYLGAFTEEYVGAFESREDFVQERIEELNPDFETHLNKLGLKLHFIDWNEVVEDWFEGGTYYSQEVDGLVYVFVYD